MLVELLSRHTNVPVVMLELDLRIRRFTPMAERFFNLVPTDIGRRFGDIKPKVHIPHLDRLITRVINTMAVHEQEVVDEEGRYYQLSIRPCHNPENKIDGAVLVFVDIDSIKRASLIKEQIVDISSREQQRIAHDLHDSLGQELAAITYRVRALESRLSVAKSAEAEEAGKIGLLTETALARTHDLVKFIQPVELGTRGLIQSLKDLAQSSSRLYAIDCTFTCPRPVPFTSQEAALHVFRIAQEAVHNAVRHGKPRRVTIGLRKRQNLVELTISNDGLNFSPQRNTGKRGLGLHIMRYRASQLHGELTVQRQHPKGTLVKCLFKANVAL